MWEAEHSTRSRLGFIWHVRLALCLTSPPAAFGFLAAIQVELGDIQLAAILVFWALSLLLWIPVMTHVAAAKMPRDMLLVALYPAISILIFATPCAMLEENAIMYYFEALG